MHFRPFGRFAERQTLELGALHDSPDRRVGAHVFRGEFGQPLAALLLQQERLLGVAPLHGAKRLTARLVIGLARPALVVRNPVLPVIAR